jgi:glycosyltransferase involved in cell wall biosynthesis
VGLDEPLISVVIPCYNQSDYLSDAIKSVLHQTYDNQEIIVVDDGSTDATPDVAARYPGVHYVYQSNQGLSAARNAGIDAAKGAYLVFLDADDRLVPDALQIGYDVMCMHPDCGFVSGHHYHIKHDGTLKTAYPQEPMQGDDPYLALLMNNYIGMHATVMYRRAVFDSVGKFDTALQACEDYDFYLRVAREYPTVRHDQIVAEYRLHDANMSRDALLMVRSVVYVLNAQRCHFEGRHERIRAYRTGIHNWVNYYGQTILRELTSDLNSGDWLGARTRFVTLLRYSPFWIRGLLK